MRHLFIVRGLVAACSLLSVNAFAQPALHLSAQHGKPVYVAGYAYATPSARPLALDLNFHKADAERVRALLRANLGSTVTAGIGAVQVVTPVVRAVPATDGLQLSLTGAKTFDAVKAALAQV